MLERSRGVKEMVKIDIDNEEDIWPMIESLNFVCSPADGMGIELND
jgi:hypothetical protein